MALDDTQPASAADLEALRLRVDRLELDFAREIAALRSPGAVPKTMPPAPARVAELPILPHTVPPPPLAPPVFAAPPPPVSLENRLGSQIFNRIAIVALLIGTAYGLKLAIDNRWIGETGRVLIGLLAGAGLILWSERFRRQRVTAFAFSLKAVGSGVLYLSLWAAFQLYHLMPASVALGAMLLVTAWNAFMAWTQDAELLAAYALIGGFATPLLLSTGGNHKIFLFTYILAIDLATVLLIRLKTWPRLLLGTFPITVLFFIGWYVSWYHAPELAVTTVFLLLFWSVFVAASLGERDQLSEQPLSSVLLPLANAAFLSLGLYSVLQDSGHHPWLPWMVLTLAAAYLGLMRLPQPRVTSAIHLALAIVFLTIAIPLKASGHWITVAWLVEGVALFWVSTRMAATEATPGREEKVVAGLAFGALTLGFVAVFLSSSWYIWNQEERFNHDQATALIGIAAFACVAWLALRPGNRPGNRDRRVAPGAVLAVDLLALLLALPEVAAPWWLARRAFYHADLAAALAGLAVLGAAAYTALRLSQRDADADRWRQLAAASFIAFNLVAVITGVREIAALWTAGPRYGAESLKQALAISAFLMLYGAALLAAGFWKRSAFVRWQGLVLLVFTIAKTFLYDIASLSQGYRVVSFLGLGALLMGVSFAYQKDWLSLRELEKTEPKR